MFLVSCYMSLRLTLSPVSYDRLYLSLSYHCYEALLIYMTQPARTQRHAQSNVMSERQTVSTCGQRPLRRSRLRSTGSSSLHHPPSYTQSPHRHQTCTTWPPRQPHYRPHTHQTTHTPDHTYTRPHTYQTTLLCHRLRTTLKGKEIPYNEGIMT